MLRELKLDRRLLYLKGVEGLNMRTLTFVLGALIVTLMSVQVSASTPPPSREPSRAMQTCKIVTGYGTAIGKGPTLSAAREEARLTCGTHMIDQYFAQRRDIPESAKDDLALACVNLDCQ